MPLTKLYLGKTFKDVIEHYRKTEEFLKLRPNSKRLYERIMRIATVPDGLGSTPCEEMRPALVKGFLDGFASRPALASKALTVIKAIEEDAVVRELLPGPISFGVKVAYKSGGHKPWSDAQIAWAQAHATPHMSRAVSLAVNTGQRGGDLMRMRWTDIEHHEGHPFIHVVQEKTGVEIWIPLTQELIRIMATWERQPGHILRKADGMPFDNRPQLSDAWGRELQRPVMASLKGLHLHGLRATAVIRLRRAGASIPHITDFVGMSEQMVTRYCRFADKRKNALAAVEHLESKARVIAFPAVNKA